MTKKGDRINAQMVHVSFISRTDEEGWPDEDGTLLTQRFVYKKREESIYLTMTLKQAKKLQQLLNNELDDEDRISRNTLEEFSLVPE